MGKWLFLLACALFLIEFTEAQVQDRYKSQVKHGDGNSNALQNNNAKKINNPQDFEDAQAFIRSEMITKCGNLCWHNKWETRDRKAKHLGMMNDWRCSVIQSRVANQNYNDKGRCYCIGPPMCGCGHPQCYYQKKDRRDEEAKEKGGTEALCSYTVLNDGIYNAVHARKDPIPQKCYCWGEPCVKKSKRVVWDVEVRGKGK